MFTWIKRLLVSLLFVVLIALNILTLFSTIVFEAMSAAIEQLTGMNTAASKLRKDRALLHTNAQRQKAAVRALRSKAIRRTRRLVAYQLMEAGASHLPLAGTVLVLGGTIWELKILCEGLKDLEEITTTFEIVEEDEDQALMDLVCNPRLPTISSDKSTIDPQ